MLKGDGFGKILQSIWGDFSIFMNHLVIKITASVYNGRNSQSHILPQHTDQNCEKHLLQFTTLSSASVEDCMDYYESNSSSILKRTNPFLTKFNYDNGSLVKWIDC